MSKRTLSALICIFATLFVCTFANAAGKARHVVVVVWDGMRPDFITPELTPNAWRMASGGVTFANHHPVYLSATEVNGTAIATGCYPEHSGLIANKEFRPLINPTESIRMENLADVRKGDEISGGHYLHEATTAEILQKAGYRSVIAGAKPVALLHDRLPRAATSQNVNLFAGVALPETALAPIVASLGPFPDGDGPLTRNDWTTRALVGQLWQADIPAYTVLWLNEPDASQHKDGLGSPAALAAIKNVDDNLGRVIHALETKGVLNETDIFLVSDHGFSTIGQRVDVAKAVKQAGFPSTTKVAANSGPDDIVAVSNGGSYLFYVKGHDAKLTGRLVEFLQQQDYVGVIFTRQPMDGTFALADGKIDSPDAPDIVFSMRWSPEKNTNGVPGTIAFGLYDYGEQGMHVSLSQYDMHNTLLAAGPDFRKGVVDRLPTGNVDVAPTALWLLGVKPPKPMDGRVLTEALTIKGPELKSYEPERLETSRKLGTNVWRQYLNFAKVNGVTYFEDGNGGQTPQ